MHLNGCLVRVRVCNSEPWWPSHVRLGFTRRGREPAIVLRSPMINRKAQGILYCWVPKGALDLHLVDERHGRSPGDTLSIRSVRTVSLLELGLRALFKSPRKVLAIANLFLARNQRGVSFRFARLADELNVLPYRRWLARHRSFPVADTRLLKPSLPVVLLTFDKASPAQTSAAMNSVERQTWRNFRRVERRDLAEFQSERGGRSYLWLNVPAGSILADEALERLTEPFASDDVSVVYSDEDRLGFGGRHHSPFLKPAWSPLLAQSGWLPLDGALVRLSAVPGEVNLQTTRIDEVVLAVARSSGRSIRHLPQILLSRSSPRRRLSGPSKPTPGTRSRPKVTVIVPIRDRPDLLATCMEGLQRRTEGVELDVVIIDNDSRQPDTLDLLQHLQNEGQARALSMPGAFNFARACNLGVDAARHELVLLLNNDVDPIYPDWLTQMSAELRDQTVGAVGAYLLYPDGFVQHAGVTLGAGSIARHSFSFIHPEGGEDRGLLRERRDVSAVTAACLLTTRHLWRVVGGMDEDHLAVAFNDVDYCLKLREMGKRVIWTPHAKLWHRESVSRGKDDTEEKARRFACEEAAMHRRWSPWLTRDPFHNPNLSRVGEDFVLEAFPEDLGARSSSWS